ncbi:hypothetical protein [Clostridium pasteurianum]|uniref:Uncharacterized protein n=1 Tax=Clostridium pasteurianum BC1 TaxID=86416 RepID=R4KAS0_CLOPA|nr:hypothetical protein [Clostridium pasteurianum]AGK97604.1 hypothetical protein Clopa_2765 [Clostridium pasteurianum BC1]
MDENNIERYCSVEKSIEESLKQIKEYKQGKRKLKTWREYRQEWQKLIDEIAEEE